MHPNVAMIATFYTAFAAGNHQTMAASYADEATFSDPVFPLLDADAVRAMWRMFCTGGNDIAITFDSVTADDMTGAARWQATYAFPRTGRRVHNVIQAQFTFQDGLIVRHRDEFDFYRWTRMALGPVGTALGWTPLVHAQVRKQAAAQLRRFQAGEQQGPG